MTQGKNVQTNFTADLIGKLVTVDAVPVDEQRSAPGSLTGVLASFGTYNDPRMVTFAFHGDPSRYRYSEEDFDFLIHSTRSTLG